MNRVKRAARKRYYIKIGLHPTAADMASDNRIFRGHFRPGIDKQVEIDRDVDVKQRGSRATAFVRRMLGVRKPTVVQKKT